MSDKPLTIMIDDTRPNLKRLREKDKAKFLEIVRTFMAIAEEAANDQVPIPWYELPQLINPKMTMKMIASAVLRAAFRADQLNKETFSVLGHSLHPLSHFGQNTINRNGSYSSWQRYFMLDPDAEVNEESIEKVVRKLLYFSRYIDIEKFGHAMMTNQLEAYKALGQENMEKLPFTPALRYQQKHFGDLKVGQFWDDIGAFDCGELESLEDGCPACGAGSFTVLGDYAVCSGCNAGFKDKAD